MKSKANGEQTVTNVFNIIGNGTNIKGDVNASGDIRIDGSIVGNLTTAGKLIIGEQGYIEGETSVKIADISGSYKGKLTASQLVILRSTSKFDGDLFTKKVVIEEGSVFNGTLTMEKGMQQKTTTQPRKEN